MNTQAELLWSHGGLQWISLAIGVGEVAGSLLLVSHGFLPCIHRRLDADRRCHGLAADAGLGLVRDLREAMSLGTAQAGAVFASVNEWNGTAAKSIAGCLCRSNARTRFGAQQRIGGRRCLTRFIYSAAPAIGAAANVVLIGN